MVSRTVAEAGILQAVSTDELYNLRGTIDDILCYDGHTNLRIRWVSTVPETSAPRPPRVSKTGLTGWCRVVSAEGADVPTGPVRIHFCSHMPCRGSFRGVQVETPRYHVVALRLIARDCHVEEACTAEGVSTPSTSKAPALSALAEPTVLALSAPAEPLPNTISPRIAELAEAWMPSFRYVGLFAFLFWGIQNQKEVRVWLWEDQFVDLVATNAPWVYGADSSVAEWPIVQVLACRLESVGDTGCVSACMVKGPSQVCDINHYMPLVDLPGGRRTVKPQHPVCNGGLCDKMGGHCMATLIAQTCRFGAIPYRSIADGNCAFDVMLFHSGKPRTELARKSLRIDITKGMLQVAGDSDWEATCIIMEGHSATSAKGGCTASTPTEPALAAPVEPQPKAAVISVISEPAVHKMSLYPQPDPIPVLALAEDLPALLEDDDDGPPALKWEESDSDSDDEDEDAPALAEHLPSLASGGSHPDEQPNLDAAILQKMGLTRLSIWESKLLLKKLSPEEKKRLAVESAEMSSRKSSKAVWKDERRVLRHCKERKDHRVGKKRKHSEMIAAYAAKHGVDSRKRVPYHFWTGFYKEALADQICQRGLNAKQKMYWNRRLKDSCRATRCRAVKSADARFRADGAGPPVKQQCIEEELILWFSGVRRRGGRVA